MTDDATTGNEKDRKKIDVSDIRSALKGMVSFFTLWHMDIEQKDMDAMEHNFYLVPIVGMMFAVIILVELLILGLMASEIGFGSGMFTAIVILGTVYIGSKFIHFDGLTDFGDGMIVSGQREDHVRALKDTLVGAGGIGVALVVVLASVAAYSMCGFSLYGVTWLLLIATLAEILVKNAMVAAAAFGEPGHGMAGRQVSLTTVKSLYKSIVVSVVCGVIMILLAYGVECALVKYDPAMLFNIVDGIFMLVIGLVVSIVAGWLMARTANRNFGMVNGDILGATNEISRAAIVIILCIVAAISS